MDVFMEKIVAKKRDVKDNLIIAGIVFLAFIVAMAVLTLKIPVVSDLNLNIFLFAAVVYLAYRFVTGRNVEFEYIVTNGDLDIDKIISKRRRKRIFSASCREFDILARTSSNSFSQSVQALKSRIDASSNFKSPDAYFATLNYKGEKTLVIFEPDEKMLNSFKQIIPRKVFTN